MEPAYLYPHWLQTDGWECTSLPQVNDTENVQEEMLSFESEMCYVLHIFSPLSLMRVIEASSETLLLMQQGAHVSWKCLSVREWVHSTAY